MSYNVCWLIFLCYSFFIIPVIHFPWSVKAIKERAKQAQVGNAAGNAEAGNMTGNDADKVDKIA